MSLGAGRLGCNATHMVDLVRMASGQDVVAVNGWLDTTGTPDPRGPEFTDPGGHAVMHLSDGARVHLDQMEDVGAAGGGGAGEHRAGAGRGCSEPVAGPGAGRRPA
ncbi:MAG: hypothetical protein M5U09_18325 [Gammaproteobacteria bacterium]|nr:hypothetical protein [Gammaproteobacteria bacterium]